MCQSTNYHNTTKHSRYVQWLEQQCVPLISTHKNIAKLLVYPISCKDEKKSFWKGNKANRKINYINNVNAILEIVVEIAKMCCETANKIWCIKTRIQLIYEGHISKTPHRNRHKTTLLDSCTDWRVIADIDRQLAFPIEITLIHQHPDLVIWSVKSRKLSLLN